ncbi:MAG: acetylxylan esterase [Chloroflexi bacterium]|nr:acetylxylan esterase [Chloroflexota bacterium]
MKPDFDAFWESVDAELMRLPMAAELQPLPMRSTDAATTYAVRLTSLGPYRIFGYYSVPNVAAPVPGLLLTPRYGSVNHVPDYLDRERYAVLQVVHRGQRLADQPFAAAYPGLLTLGIEHPETYIYRSIVADCLRGAEFLLARPEVDGARVGIHGDDLALLTAARRSGFRAVQVGELLLHGLLESSQRSDAYPAEEVNDFLRAHPDAGPAIATTLAYFDPLHHAPRVTATTLFATSNNRLEPLRAAVSGPCAEYPRSHQGAVDQDWLDAWLADQLGTQPRSRFRAHV